ncbi:MAG: hypothetical protein RBS91_01450 [Sulfurimonadaceae bacterium]|jgi:hypothetical protein|nr:hypothetical protein [Sulfurimonadaceae bacterium]
MKITKMSLVAALLVGSSVYADNDALKTITDSVKFDGNVNLFYGTIKSSDTVMYGTTGFSDKSKAKFFDKDSSAADASLNLALSADLLKNDYVTLSGKVAYTVLTTLGLENSLVSNVWGSAHSATVKGGNHHYPAKVGTENYFTEAYIAATAGKTTAQIGRMELDTPLAFSEKWSAETNTFEAIALINQDIPDTTLVGAWIGNGNGTQDGLIDLETVGRVPLAFAGVVDTDGEFNTFGGDGAYAVGAVNNSWKPLTAQAWYYAVKNVANALWLQADLNIDGILAGAQFSNFDYDSHTGLDDNKVWAVMGGYKMKDVGAIKLAYSKVGDKEKGLSAAGYNVATASGDTKLYTKTYWNYGMDVVTDNDARAYKVCASSPLDGWFDAMLSYTDVKSSTEDTRLKEIAVVAKKSFGPLDLSGAYLNVKRDDVARAHYLIAKIGLNF